MREKYGYTKSEVDYYLAMQGLTNLSTTVTMDQNWSEDSNTSNQHSSSQSSNSNTDSNTSTTTTTTTTPVDNVVVDLMKEAIASGKLPAGTKLPLINLASTFTSSTSSNWSEDSN